MSDLEKVLSAEDLEQLKLAGLIDKIESGDFMPDYLTWLGRNRPELELRWKYVQYLGDNIQQLVDGKIKKLMISMHPRIGKSTIITTSLPVFMVAKDPRTKIILSAYNQTLANKFSVQCRSFAERIGIVLNPAKRARDEWEVLDSGGGIRAVGVGAGIAGYGGDLVVLDDPIRSRKDANSPTVRDSIYEWYKSDVYTRMDNPNAKIVLIATRWHEDDLFGRILSNEGELSEENPDGWHVVNLPAIATESDILGRKPGEALCPDRFNLFQLEQIRKVLGRDFESLYQGVPSNYEGAMVKRSWFKFIEHIPRDEINQLQYIRFWDKASSPELTADYTAGVLLAHSRKSKNIYILDAVQFRLSTYERDQKMLEIARKDHYTYGNVLIRTEIEPGSAGLDAQAAMVRLFQGFNIRGIRPSGDKVTRFEPFVSQLEGGSVYLMKGDWNREYIQCLTAFPSAKHDDLVDATSGAFNDIVTGNSFIIVGKKF